MELRAANAARQTWRIRCGKIGFHGATPVLRPSSADQAAATLTLANTDGEIAGLTIPPEGRDLPTQAEVQGLRDTCQELAAEVRALAVQLLLVFPVG